MSNTPHILVIDDEPQILRAIRTILTEKGFRVTTASRGEEGLTSADEGGACRRHTFRDKGLSERKRALTR